VRIAALALATIAAAMLIGYLVRRPPLSPAVRLWLLAAVGIFPVGAVLTGNVSGLEVSKQRSFCASCHPMDPYTRDAADPNSNSLAAIHSRNRSFGHESCYACHRDYGLFGTATTKLGGLRHAWAYYAGTWNEPIRLYRPYSNSSCTYCHSTTLSGFAEEPEHAAMEEELARGTISCAADGCHGPPHPLAEGAGE
jgi:cytochrome c-type protein NapC